MGTAPPPDDAPAFDEYGEEVSLDGCASVPSQLSLADYARVAQASGAPPCFTLKQWDNWRELARTMPPRQIDGYCADCTPEYKFEMDRQGRCSFPETAFRGGDGVRVLPIVHHEAKQA